MSWIGSSNGGVSSGVSWGNPTTVQIVGGIAPLSGSGSYLLLPESGVSDDLDKLTGLVKGDEVIISAPAGNTIVVKDGAFIEIGGADFTLNSEVDKMRLISEGSDVVSEVGGRSSND